MAAPYRWRDDTHVPNPIKPGAVVVSAFPSAGLATTVAAHYMIRALALPRIGILDSDDAPPLAIVQQGQVQPSIRVYGRSDLAIVMSEFPPQPNQIRPIADAILDSAERLQARFVLAIEGVVPHPMGEEAEGPTTEVPEQQVWSVVADGQGSLAETLKQAEARPLTEGVIGGISGALLVLAQFRKMPVGGLLVSARDTDVFPDHRAGAALIEVIDRVLPDVQIDTKPLRTQAEVIERSLRAAMKNQKSPETPAVAPPPQDVRSIYQ
jgi:predicted ATP-grasp superfamily ATP-dependent carboligase